MKVIPTKRVLRYKNLPCPAGVSVEVDDQTGQKWIEKEVAVLDDGNTKPQNEKSKKNTKKKADEE